MKSSFSAVVLISALTLIATDALAMNGHGRRRGGSASSSSESYSGGRSSSVPEPSLLYAVGSGLTVLGGAGWYIRRRK